MNNTSISKNSDDDQCFEDLKQLEYVLDKENLDSTNEEQNNLNSKENADPIDNLKNNAITLHKKE